MSDEMPPDVITRREFDELVRGHQAIQKFLFGENGEVGMDENFREVMKWIGEQKKAADRRQAWWDKFQWVIIPMVLSGITVFAWQAFVFWFEIAPKLQSMQSLP